MWFADWLKSVKSWVSEPPHIIAILFFFFGATVMYFIMGWHYDGIIKEKNDHIQNLTQVYDGRVKEKDDHILNIKQVYDGRINGLEERLVAKEEQLNVYRLKLNEVTATGTSYTLMTNKDLRIQANKLVKDLRNFEQQYTNNEESIRIYESSQIRKAKSKDEIEKMGSIHWNQGNVRRSKHQFEYDQKFKSKAILLRDEMLSRLPREVTDKRKADLGGESYFEWLYNGIIPKVVDDLEQLAMSLPDASQYKEE